MADTPIVELISILKKLLDRSDAQDCAIKELSLGLMEMNKNIHHIGQYLMCAENKRITK